MSQTHGAGPPALPLCAHLTATVRRSSEEASAPAGPRGHSECQPQGPGIPVIPALGPDTAGPLWGPGRLAGA